MRLNEFKTQLKQGHRPPLTLILGEEAALQDDALTAIRALVPEAERAMNEARYDLRQTPVAAALDDALSPPFFGTHRLVVLQNPYFLTGETGGKIDHDLDGLTAYFNQPVDSTMMVVVAPYPKLDERKRLTKALKRQALVVDASPLTERDAKQAVVAALKAHQLTVTPGALALLVQRTNADYSAMRAQVPKLVSYATGGTTIDEAAVVALVPKQLTDRVFDLVAAVVAKDVTEALTLYQEFLLQKEEPLRLNSLLISQFRLLLQVKLLAAKGYSQGSVAQTLKVHPYRVKLAWRTNVNTAALEAAYIGLVEAETAMKTGRIDHALAFELFVLQYAG